MDESFPSSERAWRLSALPLSHWSTQLPGNAAGDWVLRMGMQAEDNCRKKE